MRATAEILNPNLIDVTLTITMNLGEWKELREQLQSKWPSWKLSEAISDVTRKIERQVYYNEAQEDR